MPWYRTNQSPSGTLQKKHKLLEPHRHYWAQFELLQFST
ncbi:hypothetical protein Nmel_009180 [Mimus melanotis]